MEILIYLNKAYSGVYKNAKSITIGQVLTEILNFKVFYLHGVMKSEIQRKMKKMSNIHI
jgi:Iap family predicted aminopeptidase